MDEVGHRPCGPRCRSWRGHEAPWAASSSIVEPRKDRGFVVRRSVPQAKQGRYHRTQRCTPLSNTEIAVDKNPLDSGLASGLFVETSVEGSLRILRRVGSE